MFKPRAIASLACLVGVVLGSGTALADPPVRAFDAPDAPEFKVLKRGQNPGADEDGNFVIGPDYVPAPENKVVDDVRQG